MWKAQEFKLPDPPKHKNPSSILLYNYYKFDIPIPISGRIFMEKMNSFWVSNFHSS